jgi:hypothetical protein
MSILAPLRDAPATVSQIAATVVSACRATAGSLGHAGSLGPAWAGLGDWGAIDVAGLIGWGYLKHFVWTIYFGRRVYVLGLPEGG